MSNSQPVPTPSSVPPWLHARLPKPGLVALVGSMLAAAANCLPWEILPEIKFLLGPFIYWTILLGVRSPLALIPALVANMVALYSMPQPHGGGFHGMEAIVVYLAVHHGRRSAVLSDIVYWAVMIALFYLGMLGDAVRVDPRLEPIYVLKFVANGLMPLGLTSLLMEITPLGSLFGHPRSVQPALRPLVVKLIMVLAMLPLALFTIALVMVVGRANLEAQEKKLRLSVHLTAHEIDDDLQARQFLVRQYAAVLGANLNIDLTGQQRMMDTTRMLNHNFITLLVTDAEGRVIMASADQKHAPQLGVSVADRDYFKVPRQTRQPYLSNVFRGRNFGRDIILAVSAPILSPQGEFKGVVEGSVDVGRLGQRFSAWARLREIDLAVADANGRLLYAEPRTGLRPLESLRFTPIGQFIDPKDDEGSFNCQLQDLDRCLYYYHYNYARADRSGFTVITRWNPYLGLPDFYSALNLIILVVLVVAGSALLVAEIMHHQLAQPLEKFAKETSRLINRGAIEALPLPTEGKPEEIHQIYRVFNELAARLAVKQHELLESNRMLDQRVIERTHELEEARKSAEQANQLKTQYLNSTNHEIRSGLNAVLNLSEDLLNQTEDQKAKAKLRMIYESSLHVLHVNNDVLDLASLQAGRLSLVASEFDAANLCRSVALLFSASAERKGLHLRVDVPMTMPVRADSQRYRQIITNLLSNAVKYTDRGEIRLQLGMKSPNLFFTRVQDTGDGIPLELQAGIFQEFGRLDTKASRESGGTGLGLSISRRLALAMGGDLTVQSQPEEGASFLLTLPSESEIAPVAKVEPAKQGKALAALQRMRVLVVDDNPLNQEVMRSYLEAKTAGLVFADDGPSALKLLAEGSFDLALIDLQMPGMSGLQVAEAYRARPAGQQQSCVLVALSAYLGDEIQQDCRRAGFAGFIGKPIRSKTIFQELAAYASGQTPTVEG